MSFLPCLMTTLTNKQLCCTAYAWPHDKYSNFPLAGKNFSIMGE